jgi:YidC/Oxa1 family membrane protein insertase
VTDVTFFLLSNPFTAPLQALLVWLSDMAAKLPLPESISSYAVAILIVAVLVKVVTQPLTNQQQKSMRKMQALQPKINELQKKYKDDREKLSQAQMELYREHGVNPFGGCLPLVIQMVVLFGLWRAIYGLTTLPDGSPGPMAGERFLWVPNLAACEPSPLCGKETALLPYAIPILVILMVISQFLYQKVMTPPTQSSDPQQQTMNQMMKLMPLMFAYIFIKLPAGVVLYYATFNIVGLVQQTLINRTLSSGSQSLARVEAGDGATAAIDAAADSPGQSGGAGPSKETGDDGSTAGRRRRRRKGR